MGWVFVIIGLMGIATGTFMVYYGQDLLRRPPEQSQPAVEQQTLLPAQERLLGLLAKYQREFATNKLVISREGGTLHFDGEPEKGQGISLIRDLYGMGEDDTRGTQFEELMESMPPEYVRFFGEARFDNPFVVSVSRLGMQYLRPE